MFSRKLFEWFPFFSARTFMSPISVTPIFKNFSLQLFFRETLNGHQLIEKKNPTTASPIISEASVLRYSVTDPVFWRCSFFRIREESTTKHPKENSLNLQENLEEKRDIELREEGTQQTFVLMKTSWRRLEGVFRFRLQRTSSRRLQDILSKTNMFALALRLQKTPSRRLQDVLV